jgi:translation initiation factor 1
VHVHARSRFRERFALFALSTFGDKSRVREIPAPAHRPLLGIPTHNRRRAQNENLELGDLIVAQIKHKTVLFLCTGNYYRSRFAEILFNSIAEKFGLPWRATSRGLGLERGTLNVGPMARSAIVALEAMNVRAPDAFTRMPAKLTVEELQLADRIVALKQAEHLPLLEERYPGWAEKIQFWHVDDDSEALPRIEAEVSRFVSQLLGGSDNETKSSAAPIKKGKEPPKKSPTAKVGRETAGRRGKGVTTVFDLPLDQHGLQELAAALKQRCGTGGTVKDGRIEIQGDQRERIVAELEKLGYKVKRVGG